MELINLLILLGIIYLTFKIIFEFGSVLLAISAAIVVIMLVPPLLNLIQIGLNWFTSLPTKLIYLITGVQVEVIIPVWLFLIIFLIPIIIMICFRLTKKDNKLMI